MVGWGCHRGTTPDQQTYPPIHLSPHHPWFVEVMGAASAVLTIHSSGTT